jgi:AcrR family transcriptional regulator
VAPRREPGTEPVTDLRVIRTRKALRDAFTSLVCERGLEAVTVQDVAERAMVNRATFYRHFRDKFDLMHFTIDSLVADLAWRPVPTDPSSFSFEDAVDHTEAILMRLAQHADLFRAVLALGGGPRLTLKMQRFVEEVIRHRLEVLGHLDTAIPLEMIVPILSRWSTALWSWWLMERMPYPPREMAVYVVTLLRDGPLRCLGLDGLMATEGAARDSSAPADAP